MEKENAEKASTELEDSVTSGEQSSSVENNQGTANNNSAEPPQDEEVKEESSLSEKVEELKPAAEATASSSIPPETEPTISSDSADEEIPSPQVTEPQSSSKDELTNTDSVDAEQADAKESLEPSKPDETKSEAPAEAKADDVKQGDEPVIDPQVNAEIVDSTDKEASSKEESQESEKTEEKESKSSTEAKGNNEDAKSEEDDNENKDEFEGVDFTSLGKEELVEIVKKLGKYENPFRADKILQQIAPVFTKIREEERETALKKFIADGSSADDFQFNPDELDLRFDANYQLIRDKKSKKFKQQDIQRTKNLVLAEDILDELREFMDSEESNGSFSDFKTIQQKWRDLGDVPSQNSRTLWANYNALIHRFYDQRSIYFELKELDRKKNYEAKLELCEKAEALINEKNLREAIKGLNDLHHEFKHLGPVPKEVQEELWQRFKEASDKIYERRKAFVNELKSELHENQAKKEELIEKLKPYTEFSSDRIKEWNAKTKEVVAFQKEWEAIGGLPKEKAKEINKEFWGAFKKFFSNKHKFFKKLDADREENLVKKQELLAKAIELKDSQEWDKTGNELKNLQNQWREIGPVPEKMRKKLYDEFKGACDHFFENRRKGMKSSQEGYKENLKAKKAIIAEIEGLIADADKNLDKFNELRANFTEVGYVPKKNIESIKDDFQLVIEKFLNALTVLNVKEKTEISLEAEFTNLANSSHSESDLYHKEQSVRRQINKLEDDIALWQNNLEFFAHSKSTDKLRAEVNAKIDDARLQVDSLKRQLKMLRSL